MSDVTAAYEALLSQAKAMLGAAREDEWERVLELEQDYRRQAAHIRRLDEEALTEPALIQHKLQLVEALEGRLVTGPQVDALPLDLAQAGVGLGELLGRGLVLDLENDVVESVEELRRHRVERITDGVLELLARQPHRVRTHAGC